MNPIKTKWMLLLAALSCVQFMHAQNLVPNPSFENGSCVVNYNSTPAKIRTTIDNWYSASGASPDPFDICGTYTPSAYDIVVPDIINGYQYARTGNRFMGLGFYSLPFYEYIGVKLTGPLEAGETYHVSFWVACADMVSWAAAEIGMYFSTTEISNPAVTTINVLPYTPQVVNPAGNFLTDTTWQQVTGDFVAVGGEQWIVIGYFKTVAVADFYNFPAIPGLPWPKANPNYRPGVGGLGSAQPRAYYYIDDVSVQKLSTLPVRLTGFNAKVNNQHVKLQWTTGSESNNCRFEIQRSDNGQGFFTIGTIAGAVNSSSTLHYQFTDEHPSTGRSFYRLKQIDCDGKNDFSNTITVRFDLAGFSIYPNPVIGDLTVDRNANGPAIAYVYDFTGRLLLSQNIINAKEKINTTRLLPGNYILKVESDKGSMNSKFIKR